jgi:hypothetical protein
MMDAVVKEGTRGSAAKEMCRNKMYGSEQIAMRTSFFRNGFTDEVMKIELG